MLVLISLCNLLIIRVAGGGHGREGYFGHEDQGAIGDTTSGLHKRRGKKRYRGCRGGQKKKEKGSLHTGIFNLSDTIFTKEELKVLELGLKYAPTKNIDEFKTFIGH